MMDGPTIPAAAAGVSSIQVRTVTLLAVLLFGVNPLLGAAASQQPSAICAPVGATSMAATPTDAGEAAPTWTAIAPMPRPRSELAAAVVAGTIFVVGGFGGLPEVDCFHPATGLWGIAADLPAGVHHPGVASLDGVVYVAGGYGESGAATGALWAYDPVTDAWTSRAALPTARGALGLSALGGRLYAIGGATDQLGGPVTGAVEIYDPASDTWSAATVMGLPREHLAVVAGPDRLYAVGGRANGSEDEKFAAAAEAYDPVVDRWMALPPLPTPRGGLTGVFAAGRVIVLGGERGPDSFDTVEAFDPVANAWTSLPPMPTARHGLASATAGDTVYAIAGSTRAALPKRQRRPKR